jgi:apolipoprotein N-acyltransferase
METQQQPVTGIFKISIKRIKAGSLFKIIALSCFAITLPMFLFFGVLALFGAETVRVGENHMTGVMGLVSALIMAPFFAFFLSLFVWIGAYIGIRIVGSFRPIEVEYIPSEKINAPNQ